MKTSQNQIIFRDWLLTEWIIGQFFFNKSQGCLVFKSLMGIPAVWMKSSSLCSVVSIEDVWYRGHDVHHTYSVQYYLVSMRFKVSADDRDCCPLRFLLSSDENLMPFIRSVCRHQHRMQSSIKEEGADLEEIGAGSPCDKRYFISEMSRKKCSFCPVFQNEGKFTSAICVFLWRPAAFALPKAVQDYRLKKKKKKKKKTEEICLGIKWKKMCCFTLNQQFYYQATSRVDYCQTWSSDFVNHTTAYSS